MKFSINKKIIEYVLSTYLKSILGVDDCDDAFDEQSKKQ